MYDNVGNELQTILVELNRLNGGNSVPMFTNKGKALTDIAHEAGRLKNGSYGVYPKYTSEGQLLDDIGMFLSAAPAGGGPETPSSETDLEVPNDANSVTGTPGGDFNIKTFEHRVEVFFTVSSPGAFSFTIPLPPGVPAPAYSFSMELPDGSMDFTSGIDELAFQSPTGGTFIWFNITICYYI